MCSFVSLSSKDIRAVKRHAVRTCVIFLCLGWDVTVFILQLIHSLESDYSQYLSIFLTNICFYVRGVKHPVCQQGKNIHMCLFIACQLLLIFFFSPSESFIPSSLSRSLSHWFSLSASGLHQYLASSHGHTCTRTHTLHNVACACVCTGL